MASIYEIPPHFVLEKTWDEKTRLPKTYKLQSSDSWNKIKAKVHQDSGKLGVEFTIDKTIPEFEKGAKKVNLNYAHSFVEFKNVLQEEYKTAWKQVVHEHLPGTDRSGECTSWARLLKWGKLLSCCGAFHY
jgi:hypothetical protein